MCVCVCVCVCVCIMYTRIYLCICMCVCMYCTCICIYQRLGAICVLREVAGVIELGGYVLWHRLVYQHLTVSGLGFRL